MNSRQLNSFPGYQVTPLALFEEVLSYAMASTFTFAVGALSVVVLTEIGVEGATFVSDRLTVVVYELLEELKALISSGIRSQGYQESGVLDV